MKTKREILEFILNRTYNLDLELTKACEENNLNKMSETIIKINALLELFDDVKENF